VGKAKAQSLELWLYHNPPQAVENRKITIAAIWRKSALFLAGKALAKKGNTLGHLVHPW
jgi:hypothetical protein